MTLSVQKTRQQTTPYSDLRYTKGRQIHVRIAGPEPYLYPVRGWLGGYSIGLIPFGNILR